jgi:hypothetical protein
MGLTRGISRGLLSCPLEGGGACGGFRESLLAYIHRLKSLESKEVLQKTQYSTLRDLGFQSRHPFHPESF